MNKEMKKFVEEEIKEYFIIEERIKLSKNLIIYLREKKQTIENEIIQISKQITPITEEIKLCNNIMQRVDKIKQVQLHEQIEQEKSQFEKEQKKNTKNRNKAR